MPLASFNPISSFPTPLPIAPPTKLIKIQCSSLVRIPPTFPSEKFGGSSYTSVARLRVQGELKVENEKEKGRTIPIMGASPTDSQILSSVTSNSSARSKYGNEVNWSNSGSFLAWKVSSEELKRLKIYSPKVRCTFSPPLPSPRPL